MTEKKILMHKDVQVATIAFDKNEPAAYLAIQDKKRLPIGVLDDIGSIRTWLAYRNVPANREYMDILLEKLNVSSSMQFAGISRNVSLTDCYWFASEEDIYNGVRWADVNFHNNHSNSNISQILFFGNKVELTNTESPDLSTNGHLSKMWKETDKGWFLIKKQNSYKQQVFGEIAAYKIAQLAGIDAIPYYYTEINNELCSVCPCIIDNPEKELVSFHQLLCSGIRRRDLENFSKDIHSQNQLKNVFVLDYLINNEDRNDWNLSFVRDAATLKYEKISSLYDHGESFGYDYFSTSALPPVKSLLTRNSVSDDIKKATNSTLKHIHTEEARETLSNLAQILRVNPSRAKSVIDACVQRIHTYNRVLEHARNTISL